MYSSLLKNHQIKGYKFNHQENIEKTIIDLLLINCQHNLMADCSGGELEITWISIFKQNCSSILTQQDFH